MRQMELFQRPPREWTLALEPNQRQRVVRLMSAAIMAKLEREGAPDDSNEPSPKDHGRTSEP